MEDLRWESDAANMNLWNIICDDRESRFFLAAPFSAREV